MARTVKGKVTVKDAAWRRIREQLQNVDGMYTAVGVLESSAPQKDDKTGKTTPMSLVAAANNFGTEDGRIPKRPFMSTAAERYASELVEFKAKLLNGIYQNRFTATQALGLLGEKHSAQIKKTITDGPWIPNSPYTIAAKGSDRPLIDTAQMRNSISHVERRK